MTWDIIRIDSDVATTTRTVFTITGTPLLVTNLVLNGIVDFQGDNVFTATNVLNTAYRGASVLPTLLKANLVYETNFLSCGDLNRQYHFASNTPATKSTLKINTFGALFGDVTDVDATNIGGFIPYNSGTISNSLGWTIGIIPQSEMKTFIDG